MKRGATNYFFVVTVFSIIFSLLMLSGSMLYAIYRGIDNGTDITRTADSATAPDAFDPNALPAPAAGNRAMAYNCKDMIYQTSNNGTKYVRDYGGVYYAVIMNERFGLYELNYGHLQPVALDVLDRASIMKLRYGLKNCNEPYMPSGAKFLNMVQR